MNKINFIKYVALIAMLLMSFSLVSAADANAKVSFYNDQTQLISDPVYSHASYSNTLTVFDGDSGPCTKTVPTDNYFDLDCNDQPYDDNRPLRINLESTYNDWDGDIYSGSLKDDIVINTQMWRGHRVEIEVQLTGPAADVAGVKIIAKSPVYLNQDETETNYDDGRIDLIGYTDDTGRLAANLTNNRVYDFYIESNGELVLIYRTVTDDGNLENGFHYIQYDVSKTNYPVNVLLTGTSYENFNVVGFDGSEFPFRIVNTQNGDVLCQGITRAKDQQVQPSSFVTCLIPNGTNIRVDVDDTLATTVSNLNWASPLSGPIYEGSVSEEVTIVSSHSDGAGQDIEIDLDGTNSTNRKIIIKGIAEHDTALDEPGREDFIGYTNSDGILKVKGIQTLFFKVYLDEVDLFDANLILATQTLDDVDSENNFHKLKLNLDDSYSLIDIELSGSPKTISGGNQGHPIQVTDSTGNILAQGMARYFMDTERGFKAAVNHGDISILRSSASDAEFNALTDGVIYNGSIQGNLTILTRNTKSSTTHLEIELTGNDFSGRPIVIKSPFYMDAGVGDSGYNATRVDLVGYTDDSGFLQVELTSDRIHDVYIVNASNQETLIYRSLTDDGILEDDFNYIKYDVDSTNYPVNILLTNTQYHHLSNTDFDTIEYPFRVVDTTTAGTICRGITRTHDQKVEDSSYVTCLVPANSDIRVDVDSTLTTSKVNLDWSTGGSGPVYTGAVSEETNILSHPSNTYGQEIEIDLDGLNSINRKIIIKGIARVASEIVEPSREDFIGYTNSEGILKVRGLQTLFFKVYLGEVKESNLLMITQTVNDIDFEKDYHKIKLNLSEPYSFVDIELSSVIASSNGGLGTYPIRILNSAGEIVSQGITRYKLEENGFRVLVNHGDISIERNNGLDDTWGDASSGIIYDGSIQEDIKILTSTIETLTNNIVINLGSSHKNKLITIYDINELTEISDDDLNRIGCQGYTDSTGVLECKIRLGRHIVGYVGDNTGNIQLFDFLSSSEHTADGRYDFNYNNSNLNNLNLLKVTDMSTVFNTDETNYYGTPIYVLNSEGKLVCSGRTTKTISNFNCYLPSDELFWVFSMAINQRNPATDRFYFTYRGNIGSGVSLTTYSDSDQYAFGSILKVHVEDISTNDVENSLVSVDFSNGESICSGWTSSDGDIYCNVFDYNARDSTGVTAAPQYTVKVQNSGADQVLDLYYSSVVDTSASKSDFTIDDLSVLTSDRIYSIPKSTNNNNNIVYFRQLDFTVDAGSNLEKGNLKISLFDDSSNNLPLDGETVSLYRSGTNIKIAEGDTDVSGIKIFTNIDPYFAYDVKTPWGEKTNVRISSGESLSLSLRMPSTTGVGESTEIRESRPSLLTLSGNLKNKSSGEFMETGSFQIYFSDSLGKTWYDLNTGVGYCFEDKVYRGEFGFIIGGMNPLYLVEDKIYTINIDVFAANNCSNAKIDTFTTYFKG